jgi:hypothetical protein
MPDRTNNNHICFTIILKKHVEEAYASPLTYERQYDNGNGMDNHVVTEMGIIDY